jgi:peptidoglycan hydrolase-like protein with peptidoglycan-binding domain
MRAFFTNNVSRDYNRAIAQGLLGQSFARGSSGGGAGGTVTGAGGGASVVNAKTSMPTLRIGARGLAVADLQRQLKAAGFNSGPIDGKFGPQTQAAVRKYQAAHGLVVDGGVGEQTWVRCKVVAADALPPASLYRNRCLRIPCHLFGAWMTHACSPRWISVCATWVPLTSAQPAHSGLVRRAMVRLTSNQIKCARFAEGRYRF